MTIAEDAEFAAYLAETGTRVWFVPEAVTYDEAPTSVLVSLRQRRRWSSGVMDVAQVRLGSLACGVFDEGGLRALDMLLMLTQPFCQVTSFFLGCALVLVQPNAARAMHFCRWGSRADFSR
ncbi:MAG: glycosyltransferase family 2 protein [Oscillospiraceae bacterium]